MNEIWKDISGYAGIYQISSLGRVKSLSRISNNRTLSEKLLTPSLSNSGYACICLSNNKYKKYSFIHRIIAQSFIPNPMGKKQVNHIDGVKANNSIDNLEWATNSENQKHAYKNNLNRISELQKKRTSEAKSSSVIDTESNIIYSSIREALKTVSIPYSTLCTMLRGEIENKTSLRFLNRRNNTITYQLRKEI